MDITCDFCHNKLEEPGALVFNPPDKHDSCWKLHMCVTCWKIFQGLNWGHIFRDEPDKEHIPKL